MLQRAMTRPLESIEDRGFAQSSQRRLLRHQPAKACVIACNYRRRTGDILRHGENVAPDRLLMFPEIGLRDRVRFSERCANPVAEPRLNPKAEEQGGGYGDNDRRRNRDQAEQNDEARMKPRSDGPAPAFHPELHQPFRHDSAERQKQYKVDIEQDQDGADIGFDAAPAG